MESDRVGRLTASVSREPLVYSAGFRQWLASNRRVFNAFEYRALRLWLAGRRHYSARTIMESIRHDTDVAEVGGTFKINNNIIPDCARLFLTLHPECAGFFELRWDASPGGRRAA
jgi:hypothetical protein